MALYIECTLEDMQREFANRNHLNTFSAAGLAAILEWYDENGINQELDVIEICNEWEEYVNDEQNVIELENGNYLVRK